MGRTDQRKMAGVMALFDNADDTLAAAHTVAKGGLGRFEVYSPFPIHGMDAAMGLKRSKLPFITFVAGVTGFCAVFALQYWTSVINWPINIGGKPMNSWPAFVPPEFEGTILFAGIATVFGMFAINRLPNLTKKAFDPRITNDRFAVVIEADGNRAFDEKAATEFLKSKTAAKEVRTVFAEGWF